MNRFATAALCGSLAFCGAQAFANATSTGASVEPTSHTSATEQKLMTECMSHEGNSNTQAKEDCRAQVENQLIDMKNAGTQPGQRKPGQ